MIVASFSKYYFIIDWHQSDCHFICTSAFLTHPANEEEISNYFPSCPSQSSNTACQFHNAPEFGNCHRMYRQKCRISVPYSLQSSGYTMKGTMYERSFQNFLQGLTFRELNNISFSSSFLFHPLCKWKRQTP